MKSKKKLIISMVVLALVTVLCFVTGAVCIAAGGVQAIAESDLPEKLEELDIDEGVQVFKRYMGYIVGGDEVSYDSKYLRTPFEFTNENANNQGVHLCENVIIENCPYDIEIKGMTERVWLEGSFEGKYPSELEGEPVIVDDMAENGFNIKFADMPGFIDHDAGKLTIYIPKYYETNLQIKNCAGQVTIDAVDLTSLNIESFAGEINGTKVIADEVKINSLVGEIDLDGTLGMYNIENCIGEIKFSSAKAPVADSIIKDGIAEIEIELPESAELYIVNRSKLADINCEVAKNNLGAQFTIEDVIGEVTFSED